MPDYTKGYQRVPDSGDPVPYPCGTEEANEATAPKATSWAKRKGGSANGDTTPGDEGY